MYPDLDVWPVEGKIRTILGVFGWVFRYSVFVVRKMGKEVRGKREEGRGKREEGRGKREEGRLV